MQSLIGLQNACKTLQMISLHTSVTQIWDDHDNSGAVGIFSKFYFLFYVLVQFSNLYILAAGILHSSNSFAHSIFVSSSQFAAAKVLLIGLSIDKRGKSRD
jgi:hypothetical protein